MDTTLQPDQATAVSVPAAQQSSGIPMLAPNETSPRYVPPEQVKDAMQKGGGKVVVRMIDPQGATRWVPFENQDAAQKAGGRWDVHPDNENVKKFVTANPGLVPGGPQAPQTSSTPPEPSFWHKVIYGTDADKATGFANANFGIPLPLDASGKPVAGSPDQNSSIVRGAEKGLTATIGGIASHLGGPGVNPGEVETKGSGEWVGNAMETLAEFYAGDAAFKALGVGEKLKKLADIADALKEHPMLARLVTLGGNASRIGTVAGTQSFAKGSSLSDAAKTGAVVGGAGAVLEAAAPVVTRGVQKLAPKLNPFRVARQVVQGADVAQAPAQAALEGATGANMLPKEAILQGQTMLDKPLEDLSQQVKSANLPQAPAQSALEKATGAAMPPKEAILQGETMLDKPLQDLSQQSKAAYKKIDDLAGFDLKEAKAQTSLDQYNLKQATDPEVQKTLQARIKANQTRIGQAEQKLTDAGIDPKSGDMLHKQMQAGADFKNALVKSTNPDGTLNVDRLLKQSKALRFGRRGDRLAQFMGADKATSFLNDLADAQKAGIEDPMAQRLSAGNDFKDVITKSTNADGTLNVNTLLDQSKALRFGDKGDRLAQFLGADKATEFLNNLSAAQKTGAKAVQVQKVAKWLGAIVGASLVGAGAYEGVQHLAKVAQ